MSKILLSNIVSGSVSKILIIVISMATVPIHLKYWGHDIYGLYITMLSLLAFVPITNCSINTSLGVLAAKTLEHSYKARLSFHAFLLVSCISIIFSVFLISSYSIWKVSFWEYLGLNDKSLSVVDSFLVLLITAFITSVFSITNGAFNGLNKQSVDNWYSIPLSTVPFMSVIVTSYFKLSFLAFSLFTLVGITLVNFIKLYHLSKLCGFRVQNINSWKRFRKKDFEVLFRTGISFLLFTISIIVITNIDNVLISKYFSLSEVTSYSLNLKLMNVVFGLVMTVNLAILPLLGNYLGGGEFDKITKTYNNSFYICYALCSFIVIWALSLGQQVIIWWAGDGVEVEKDIFIAMLCFAFLYTIVSLHTTVLSAMNISKKLPLIGGVEAFLNIFLSLVLLKYFGILGIILGSVIASALVPNIIHPMVIKRYSGNKVNIPMLTVFKLILATGPVFVLSIISFFKKVFFVSQIIDLIIYNFLLILIFYFLLPQNIKSSLINFRLLKR